MELTRIAGLVAGLAIAVSCPADPGTSAAGETEASGSDGPPLELLEFLGEWTTSEGEWVDPTAVEDGDPVLGEGDAEARR